MDLLVTLGLIVLLGLREYTAFVERKDMLDRLMSRNLPEYKDNAKPEPNQLEPQASDLTDLDEAREELDGEAADE